MLLEMLKKNTTFLQFQEEKQRSLAKLAQAFEASEPQSLELSPKELHAQTQVGSETAWFEFLNLETVSSYIRAQMGFHAQVAQRRAFFSLAKEASTGDTQAAKIVNELSGIMNNADNNKIIILHKIERPIIQEESK